MKKVGIMVMAVAMAAAGARAAAADVLYGCSNDATGKVRRLQVNIPPACHSTETLRAWDPSGSQEARGFSECHVENFAAPCDANTFAALDTSCARGFAASASAIWMSPFGGADNGNFYFWARSGNLWTTMPYNNTAAQQYFEVQLQCCS
jgi:hypothetical protein